MVTAPVKQRVVPSSVARQRIAIRSAMASTLEQMKLMGFTAPAYLPQLDRQYRVLIAGVDRHNELHHLYFTGLLQQPCTVLDAYLYMAKQEEASAAVAAKRCVLEREQQCSCDLYAALFFRLLCESGYAMFMFR